MGMKVLLLPCIYVYKGLVFILKSIVNFVKYFFLGIGVFFRVLLSPFRSTTNQGVSKSQQKFEKQKQAEQRMIEKKKALDEKRKEKELNTYINDSVKLEKKSVGEKMNDLGEGVVSFPKRISNFFKSKWDNLSLVKDAKNRKDLNREVLLINFDGEDAKKSKEKVTYEYVIKDTEGNIVKGYFQAHSKVEVHSFLLSEGVTVYSIRTNRWIQLFHTEHSASSVRFKNKDLIFFLSQLSTYIKSGIPLADAVKILIKQFKNRNYKRILQGIVYDLSTGQSFSEALAKQGKAFPNILINMIKSAEMTGELPETLDDMEVYFTEIESTRKAMVTAMMYPTIIFVIALAVGTFIMLFVVPRFVEIYQTMDNAEIPGITLAVLSLSEFLQKYIIWIFVGLIVLLILFIYLYKYVKTFRTGVQWLVMHLPVFGNVIIYNEVTMFTKTFASLLAHNVFITDSMEILNKISNNEIYKMMIYDSINNIAKGKPISEAFKDQWAFPIPAYEMIVTGERTGQLPEMMKKVANYYQDLHKNSVARIKTFIEPALIIMLTVMVGIIILSIVIPMFNMYSAIQA